MTQLFELLYDYAWYQADLTRWLFSTDDVRSYHHCIEETGEQEQKVRELVGEPGLPALLDYINSVDAQRDYERQMLFCQGLAMGLELGLWGGSWNTGPGAVR